ncbi:glycosyl hydrolase family 28-related protein [Microlunatus sp. Y2014]|uniref:glycosyl hydrolase family 28-related protein n=1 Tax=Microlunatus sp. Y2014 TaxID=3418488 RepID=UPI003DA70B8F
MTVPTPTPMITGRRAALAAVAGGFAFAATGAGSRAVAAPPQPANPPKYSPVIDVRTFGAIGDGVTDDTAALQRALDSLDDGQGLYLPAGTYLVTPRNITEFILTIKTQRISIFGESRETSVIKIADGVGPYWGILGSLEQATHWEIRDIAFDHNQQNNPLASDAEYWRPTLRYSVACYPGVSDTISIDTIDVLNSDSVVSLYFPSPGNRGRGVSIQNCRWLGCDSQSSAGYSYDQSLINVAGELVTISGCTFEGARWEKAPATAFEVHGTTISITGNTITRFQTGGNLTGISRAGTDYGVTFVGNSVEASRFGVAIWSGHFSSQPEEPPLGLSGVLVSSNSFTMRTDKYPAAYTSPRGAAITFFPSSLSLNLAAVSILGNMITYGDGVTIPEVSPGSPSIYAAAISVPSSASSAVKPTLDQLEISGNTVLHAPFAALSVTCAPTKGFHASDNNFLDCGVSTGRVGTTFGHVVLLDGEFLDDPVVAGGKISCHADTTCSALVYYRDRTATPKPLLISTTFDIRSADSSSCTDYVTAYPGSPVVLTSHLGGTPKKLPKTAIDGSRATSDDRTVHEVLGTTWVTHRSGTAAPTSGAHTAGSTVRNTAPQAGGVMGWVCVTAGTPGTWRGYGTVEG